MFPDLFGAEPKPRGFHIHQFGDLSQGCTSAGPHYNPQNVTHGSLKSDTRHAGDMGNISFSKQMNTAEDFEQEFLVRGISVNPCHELSVIGRTIVLHADEDDLGLGGHELSSTTGNAGKRFACGVIGLAK